MTSFLSYIDPCSEVLKKGGLILYPTDTVWGIGCDATDEEAVRKVYRLKQREDSKALICLVSDKKMLEQYVRLIPKAAHDFIDFPEKPTTIVYDRPMGLAKNLIAPDNTIAIRVTKDPFCQELINKFNKPIVSTSANISGMPTPGSFKMIHPDILKGVDYVVNLQQEREMSNPSSIIKLTSDGKFEIIRK